MSSICFVYVSCNSDIFSYLVSNIPENLKQYRKLVLIDTRVSNIEDYKKIVDQCSCQNIQLFDFQSVLKQCNFDFDITLFKSMKLTLKFIAPYFVFKNFEDIDRIVFLDEDVICTDGMYDFVEDTKEYCWSATSRIVGLEKHRYLNEIEYRENADTFMSLWGEIPKGFSDDFSYYYGGEYIFNRPDLKELYQSLYNLSINDYVKSKLMDRSRTFRFCFPDMWYWIAYAFRHKFIVVQEDIEVTYPSKVDRVESRLKFSEFVLQNCSHGHFSGKGTLIFYKHLEKCGILNPPVKFNFADKVDLW